MSCSQLLSKTCLSEAQGDALNLSIYLNTACFIKKMTPVRSNFLKLSLSAITVYILEDIFIYIYYSDACHQHSKNVEKGCHITHEQNTHSCLNSFE